MSITCQSFITTIVYKNLVQLCNIYRLVSFVFCACGSEIPRSPKDCSGRCKLISCDGKDNSSLLVPNTTSVIQPVDQSVISAMKRHNVRLYLDEVLAVTEAIKQKPMWTSEGSEPSPTSKITIFVLLSATLQQRGKILRCLSSQTLGKKLITDEDNEVNLEGSQADGFLHILKRGGSYLLSLRHQRLSG